MKITPILFSGEMIRALLDGRKTQTRRIVKLVPQKHDGSNGYMFTDHSGKTWRMHCPYGKSGDLLWVRETWATDDGKTAWYRADGETHNAGLPWRPSIFMRRWASRLTLEITDVRVERLQDISEEDAKAEGREGYKFPGPWWQGYKDLDGELVHQQHCGDEPPEWMINPKRMKDTPHLDKSSKVMFSILWEQINGPGSWDANPWVWAISFKIHKQNIDQFLKQREAE